jgi:hypothetical protein
MIKVFHFIVLISLFCSQSLWAAQDRVLNSFEHTEGSGDRDIIIEQDEEEEELRIGAIDSSHNWLSDYVDSLSYGLDGFVVDTFFGDDVINDDISGSRAKISFFTRREIGQPVDFKYGISLRVVLPNTDERFSVLVESSDDEESRENTPVDSVEKAEYSTALRYMFKETDNWKVSFDNGIKWGLPPDPFSRLRFRRLDYFDTYHTRITQTIDWATTDGIGEETRFEINRPLNTDRLIRVSGGARYELNEDYFELDYGLSFYHELNKKEALAYYFRASGENRNNMSFNNYGIGLRYRRLVYQDWVFVEITPELESANENYYDVAPIIMFRFEALVGDLLK